MRILTLDIESSPNLAHVWGLFKANVSLSQLQESSQIISFAAKWHGERTVEFWSDFHDGHDLMITRAHQLIDEADVLVTYNGISFDRPYLMREFLEAGFDPPSPVKDVDLYRVVKQNFRWPSGKLDYVAQRLGLGGKTKHEGHDLWVKCLAGDPAAWNRMRTYNKRDVVLTEKLYDKLLPWVSGHMHRGLFTDSDRPVCQRCGSERLQRRGLAYTQLGTYPRFQCQGCGGWSRGGKKIDGTDVRAVR